MNLEMVAFVVTGAFALAGALFAVAAKRTFHSALGLGVTLIAVAGLYVILGNALLGVVQILVYVGGILTLLVFAVMFVAGDEEEEEHEASRAVRPDQGPFPMWAWILVTLVALGAFLGLGVFSALTSGLGDAFSDAADSGGVTFLLAVAGAVLALAGIVLLAVGWRQAAKARPGGGAYATHLLAGIALLVLAAMALAGGGLWTALPAGAAWTLLIVLAAVWAGSLATMVGRTVKQTTAALLTAPIVLVPLGAACMAGASWVRGLIGILGSVLGLVLGLALLAAAVAAGYFLVWRARGHIVGGIAVSAVLLGTLAAIILGVDAWGEDARSTVDYDTGVGLLVTSVFETHVVSLEVLGILLTAAMIGALVIARPLGTAPDERHYAEVSEDMLDQTIHVADIDRRFPAPAPFVPAPPALPGKEEEE